ncbi:hypothetical protein ACYJ1Y_14385 [Natrialbaceae archaeon A-gly3]
MTRSIVATGSILFTGCLDDSTDDRTATDETEPLEEASEAYEDGMEANLDDDEETLGSSARYVEYDGVTYRVSYIVFSLET